MGLQDKVGSVGGGGPVKPIISLTHWWDYSELVREGKKKGDQKEETLMKVLGSRWVLSSIDTFLNWGIHPALVQIHA